MIWDATALIMTSPLWKLTLKFGTIGIGRRNADKQMKSKTPKYAYKTN